jgi:hypothetical protein
MKNRYKNRYGDVFTFTRDENHDILWEGNFEYCRFGMPNDYIKAYNEYVHDGGELNFNDFKAEVHKYDDETHKYIYDKYIKMVGSLKNEIDMVDPSGGPYISIGMSLGSFGFKDYVVKDFKRIDTGYKIITEKCAYCNQAAGIHKMGCETRKVTIFYEQMEKEVHQNRSNLNE